MSPAVGVLLVGLLIFWPLCMFAIITNNNRAGKIGTVGCAASLVAFTLATIWSTP